MFLQHKWHDIKFNHAVGDRHASNGFSFLLQQHYFALLVLIPRGSKLVCFGTNFLWMRCAHWPDLYPLAALIRTFCPPRKVDVCSVLSEVHWSNDGLDKTDVAVAQSSRNSMKPMGPILYHLNERCVCGIELRPITFNSDTVIHSYNYCVMCVECCRGEVKKEATCSTHIIGIILNINAKVSYVGVISVTCTWHNSQSGHYVEQYTYILVLRC